MKNRGLLGDRSSRTLAAGTTAANRTSLWRRHQSGVQGHSEPGKAVNVLGRCSVWSAVGSPAPDPSICSLRACADVVARRLQIGHYASRGRSRRMESCERSVRRCRQLQACRDGPHVRGSRARRGRREPLDSRSRADPTRPPAGDPDEPRHAVQLRGGRRRIRCNSHRPGQWRPLPLGDGRESGPLRQPHLSRCRHV